MGTLIQIPEKPGSVSLPTVWKNSLNFPPNPGCAGQFERSLKAGETQHKLPSVYRREAGTACSQRSRPQTPLSPSSCSVFLLFQLHWPWFPEFDAYLFSESLYSPLSQSSSNLPQGLSPWGRRHLQHSFPGESEQPHTSYQSDRRPPGQKSEQVPNGMILVKFSEGDRISASPELVIFSE